MTQKIFIDGNNLTLEMVEKIAFGYYPVAISPETETLISQSRETVEKILTEKKTVYGINTGFGFLKNTVIPDSEIEKLQENLIISHCAGVGEFLGESIARTMLLLRVNALIKGFSGVRLEVIKMLLDFINLGITPLIPSQGSVGASGDLAPLSHMALPLLGKGEVLYRRKILPTLDVLKENGLEPLNLKAKEGLALINGTQAITAIGAITLINAKRTILIADAIAATTLEALQGSKVAFDPKIQQIRPHPGQIKTAANLRLLLADSEILESHKDCDQVQDAYSLRCIPQVHGAVKDTIEYVEKVIATEMNSVTDNPLVFSETGEVLSGGNFHGEPVALVMDFLAIALAELGSISERRTERLVNPQLSNGLPAFLAENGGLNSGYMIAQYTAAALVSENKSLAHPASVDSIPTSANQEDHVSMGTIAARKALQILKNLENILAIEATCSVQGLEFRRPLKAGKGVELVFSMIRQSVTKLTEDRNVSVDLNQVRETLFSSDFWQKLTQYFSSSDKNE